MLRVGMHANELDRLVKTTLPLRARLHPRPDNTIASPSLSVTTSAHYCGNYHHAVRSLQGWRRIDFFITHCIYD